MSEYLQKIVYLTDSQYATLLANETADTPTPVGSQTYINDNYIYLTDGKVKLSDFDSSFILPVSKGGTGASSWASGKILVGNGSDTFSTIDKATIATGETLVERTSDGSINVKSLTGTGLLTMGILDGGQHIINGNLQLNAQSGTYNEGLRINRSTTGYANIYLGGARSSASGNQTGGWWIGTLSTPANATATGSTITNTVFTISQDSTDTGFSIQGTRGATRVTNSGWAIRPRLAVGTTYQTGYTFYVNGTSYFSDTVNIPTQSAAYTKGIQFMNSTTKKGSIGCDNSGIIAMYGAAKIALRPILDDATDGVEITTSAMIPTKNNTVALGGTSNQWSNVYSQIFTHTHTAGAYDGIKILYSTTIDFFIGVGTANANHGLYDYKASGGAKWILSADATNVWTFVGNVTGNVSGTAANVTGTVAIANGGTGLTSADPHKVLIGPSSGSTAAAPTWRTIIAADLPSASTSAAGIIQIGTGASNAMAGDTTVTNVAISANTTTNANYPIVFATSNKDTTGAKNEGLQKSGAKFYFNPSTGILTATGFAGALTGNVTGNCSGSAGTVAHTLATTTKYYMSGTTLTASGNSAATFDTNIYTTTTAGYFSAVMHAFNVGGVEKAYIAYNTTDNSIDFIFL